MRSLTAHDLIQVWERGYGKQNHEKALILLAAAYPAQESKELAALTLGQRDSEILTLREVTIGPSAQALVKCGNCSEELEFPFNITDVRMGDYSRSIEKEYDIHISGFDLRFRLPDSWDIAMVARTSNVTQARSLLIRRCLIEISRAGEPIIPDEIPTKVFEVLSNHVVELDPQAEVNFDVKCNSCDYMTRNIFEIVPFFWSEIEVLAQRLLFDVVSLARAYGWKEEEILEMSPARRNFYLEAATS